MAILVQESKKHLQGRVTEKMFHYGHRSCNCKQSTLLAVDMPSTRKKKTPGPLIAHKEKLREDLSRGNSIDFVLFLFFLSLFLALRIFCLFVFVRTIGMFPL